MSIVNLDLTAQFVFEFTQATEINEHNLDPNAHIDMITALKKAGIFIPAGAFPFERRGQHFEANVEFDGTKATVIHGGVTFTSTFNGTETNGLPLVFDGILTVDEVRAVFNAANYPNTVEHDGVGTEVLTVLSPVLASGAYVVQDKDIVYKDLDGIYKQALADGTIKSKVAGIALRSDKCVSTHGLHDINTGFAIGTGLFLSGSTPGALVNFDTNVNLGLVLGNFIYFTGFTGDVTANVSQDYDAVVTNSVGVGQFLTTQAAIDFVPSDGRILVNKLEDVKAIINTLGKNLTITVNGPDKGWRKFAGLSSSFRVDFDFVPTQGTFRIEWNSQETNDLAFNASNVDVENEFNLLSGHNGFTVTGDFTSGFTFTSNDLDNYPLPTFVFAGINETQRFDFSNIPNDGTVQFEHEGNPSLNFPWDDNAADLKIALEALASISEVNVTGGFGSQFFEIEFTGGFLEEGNQEQALIKAIMTDLDLTGATTDINGTSIVPIDASVVQKGKKPASNLYNGTTLITISTVLVQTGEQVGPDTAMNIDSTNLSVNGLGKFENFVNGIILDNAATKIVLEAYFPGTTFPVETLSKLPGNDYSFDDVQGFAKDVFSQLRITEHPINKKIAVISGADQIMASGITLTQEINSLLLQFDGAEIHFDTGEIFESDGTTPLGLDFTPVVIAADQWRWFSVNMIVKAENADLSLQGQILVLAAASDGASKELAEKAPFGDKPLGVIAIQGALGDKEKTQITTIKDTFGDRKGTALTLYSPAESVAFWWKDESLDTLQVEDTTGVTGVDENLFDATTKKVLSGKISVTGPITVDKLNLFLRKLGAPTGTAAIRLMGDLAGEPDFGNVIATVPIILNMSVVPTNYISPVTVVLNTTVILATGVYHVEVDADNYTFSAGNFLAWQAQASGTNDLFNRDPAVFAWSIDNPLREVGFELIQTIKGFPAIASAADREVEILTLVDNDLQSVVASKLRDAINGDVQFSASVTTNKIIVENAVLGDVTDADMGDSGFFKDVLVQGTDTDVTGIEDVENKNIKQLGTGSGGGGGAGDALDTKIRFQSFLDDSEFGIGALNAFVSNSPVALVDEIGSTGIFSLVSKTFNMAVAEFVRTLNLLDYDEMTINTGISKLALRTYWDNDFIDPSAVHRVSRMNGQANTYQIIDMARVGNTDVLFGAHEFEVEKLNTIVQEPTFGSLSPDVDLDDATVRQNIGQEFTLGSDRDVANINLFFKKLGSPLGKFNVVFVQDDGAGDPDLNNVITQRGFFPVSDIAGTETLIATTINELLLGGVPFHIIIFTDSVYKASYNNGVDEIVLVNGDDGAIPNYKTFDGVTWVAVGGTDSLKYQIVDQVEILDTLLENPFVTATFDLQLGNAADIALGQPYDLTQDLSEQESLTVRLTKLGSPLGVLTIGLYGDDGFGNPDIFGVPVFEKTFNVPSFVAGLNELEIDLPSIVRPSGTYFWAAKTSQEYQDNFNSGVDSIALKLFLTGPPPAGISHGKTWNGNWSTFTDASIGFILKGRDLKLILEVESSIAEAKMDAFGVAYDIKEGVIAAETLPEAVVSFTGDQNLNRFKVTNFVLSPIFTRVNIGESGQTFQFGDFDIIGDEIVFPVGQFNFPGETFVMRIDNLLALGKTIIDHNPHIQDILRDNHLGSLIPGLPDFALPGRGIKLRADDGVMVEIQVTAGPTRTIRIVDQE